MTDPQELEGLVENLKSRTDLIAAWDHLQRYPSSENVAAFASPFSYALGWMTQASSRITTLQAQVRVAYGFDRDAVFANIDTLTARANAAETALAAIRERVEVEEVAKIIGETESRLMAAKYPARMGYTGAKWEQFSEGSANMARDVATALRSHILGDSDKLAMDPFDPMRPNPCPAGGSCPVMGKCPACRKTPPSPGDSDKVPKPVGDDQ